MADLVALNVSPIFVDYITHIRTRLAGVGGLTLGQGIYTDPVTGTALPTSAATAGKFAFRGVVTTPAAGAGAGQAVDVVEAGYVTGFDLTALAFDALVYLSDTPGKLSSTPGTNSVVVGRVVALSDRDPVTNLPSKILYLRPSTI